MADTKISALAALTGAGADPADLVTAVDVSDTTMAASGTNKKMTLAELEAYLKLHGMPVTKQLGSDFTVASTTLSHATGLDQALAVGTWIFDYTCVYRTSLATNGMALGVNFSGTQTTFVVQGTQFEATTAASTGAADQVHGTFGLRSGGAARAPSTTAAIVTSTGVDTINADMMVRIEGLVVVTVAGNLELYAGKEIAGDTHTLRAPTSLRAVKVG